MKRCCMRMLAKQRWRTRIALAVSSFALWVVLAVPLLAQEIPDRCLTCHAQFDARLGEPAQKFPNDIHAQRGLTCAACHGGDATTDNLRQAKSPAKGFRGVPKRIEIPPLCARCHSDASFMRAYNPSLRTDQLAQYWTSGHGQQLRRGDTRVAVCSDCHGVHDIRPATSPLSAVHPLKIPETCAQCHSSTEHMKGYDLPTDQFATYRASLHFQALAAGNLAAPSCATCHGNHGAAPPGVASVERVCGTCHLFQEQLFDRSPHKPVFDAMQMASCVTCHSNHRIDPTSDAMVGTGEKSLCLNCHVEGDAGFTTASQMHDALTRLDQQLAQVDEVLDHATRAGMQISEARIVQANAKEKLIKARVQVHAFAPGEVDTIIREGLQLANQAHQAGQQALDELAFRRKGLALSLLAIAFVVLSLWLVLRELERRQAAKANRF